MALTLVIGPARSGKIARLLDRFVELGDRDPWLIVPNRLDVDRVERDVLARTGVLLSGTVGTFDDLFRAIAEGDAGRRPVVGDAQRDLLVRAAVWLDEHAAQ